MRTCLVASDTTQDAPVQQADGNGSVLLAYIEGDLEPPDFVHVAELIGVLHTSGEWSGSAPELVNEGADNYRTLGAVLRLHAASDRAGYERAALDDVERFVTAIERATTTWSAEFAFELDGVVVGWVAGGQRDRLLKDGLLGPWRERLSGMDG
jgi:hypothetical protein